MTLPAAGNDDIPVTAMVLRTADDSSPGWRAMTQASSGRSGLHAPIQGYRRSRRLHACSPCMHQVPGRPARRSRMGWGTAERDDERVFYVCSMSRI